MRVLAWPAHKNAASNPYQNLLYNAIETSGELVKVTEFSLSELIRGGRFDVFHLHWPDVFLANSTPRGVIIKLAFLKVLFWYLKQRGTRIVWTAHNLRRSSQSNSAFLYKWFWPWFLHSVDGVIFMSECSRKEALAGFAILRTIPNVVAPHGHYRSISDGGAATLHNSDNKTILYFGSITPYKQVSQLVKAFANLKQPGITLRITGKMSQINPDQKLEKVLGELPFDVRNRIILVERFLDDAELIHEVQSADLVVLPYKVVQNSGSVIFALSFGAPVLISDIPAFRELQDIVDTGWIKLFQPPLQSSDLTYALDATKHLKVNSKTPDLFMLEWERIAGITTNFYTTVLSGTI